MGGHFLDTCFVNVLYLDYSYLSSPGTRGEHTWWAAKFYLCEMLNFINVVVQVGSSNTDVKIQYCKLELFLVFTQNKIV